MKVWFVDDDRDELELIRHSIERIFPQASVMTFTRMPKELACDVLVLDMNMHGKSGYQIAQELREGGYTKPIVIYTGSAEHVDAEMLRYVSGVAYKQFESTLIGAVRALEAELDYCE